MTFSHIFFVCIENTILQVGLLGVYKLCGNNDLLLFLKYKIEIVTIVMQEQHESGDPSFNFTIVYIFISSKKEKMVR